MGECDRSTDVERGTYEAAKCSEYLFLDVGEYFGEIGEPDMYGKDPFGGEIGLRERTAGPGGDGRGEV